MGTFDSFYEATLTNGKKLHWSTTGYRNIRKLEPFILNSPHVTKEKPVSLPD